MYVATSARGIFTPRGTLRSIVGPVLAGRGLVGETRRPHDRPVEVGRVHDVLGAAHVGADVREERAAGERLHHVGHEEAVAGVVDDRTGDHDQAARVALLHGVDDAARAFARDRGGSAAARTQRGDDGVGRFDERHDGRRIHDVGGLDVQRRIAARRGRAGSGRGRRP